MDVYQNNLKTQITQNLVNQLPSAKIVAIEDDYLYILVDRTEEIQRFARSSKAIVYRGVYRYEIDLIELKPSDKLCELRTPHDETK